MTSESHHAQTGGEIILRHLRQIVAPETIDVAFSANRVNNILLYHGAFNPPHVGHLNFLKHSFENAGNDMKYACALMIPRRDDFLRDSKFKDVENALILPQSVRCQLCYSDDRWPAWAVVPRHESVGQDLASLKKLATSLGFRLRYTTLRGLEPVDSEQLTWDSFSPDPYVDNILVNTYGRQEEDDLQTWDLAGDQWQVLHGEGDEVRRFQRPLGTRKTMIRGHVRLIDAVETVRCPISSTQIRSLAVIKDNLTDSAVLANVALSWSQLQEQSVWQEWRSMEVQILAGQQ